MISCLKKRRRCVNYINKPLWTCSNSFLTGKRNQRLKLLHVPLHLVESLRWHASDPRMASFTKENYDFGRLGAVLSMRHCVVRPLFICYIELLPFYCGLVIAHHTRLSISYQSWFCYSPLKVNYFPSVSLEF